MTKTRVAVIGTGFFGRNHARHLARHPDCTLVGVVDANATIAQQVAQSAGTCAYSDPADVLERVDAVCIAVPTSGHLAVARPFLTRGIATFVEKPLAISEADAAQIVLLARKSGAVLQVGHIERFNPAWTAYEAAQFRPSFIACKRYSPYPFRSLDISVVLDVMIHDLDLVLATTNSKATRVSAVGDWVLSATLDRVETWIEFASGAVAFLSASRVHHESQRAMRLWDDKTAIELDFAARSSLTTFVSPLRLRTVSPNASRDERMAIWNEMQLREESKHMTTADPLLDELTDFLRCARTKSRPKVCGETALEVMSLASRIEQAASFGRHALPRRKSA